MTILTTKKEHPRPFTQTLGRLLGLGWLLALLSITTWGLAHAQHPTLTTTTTPLIELPAHTGGQPITITWHDVDMGTPPTITLYFDSLSRHDYELIYTIQWGEPISFTIPQLEHVQCHVTSLLAHCTPFYGGWLYMAYEGQPDGLTWEIDFTPPPAPPNTVACESLFPIQPEQNTVSLSADNFPVGSVSTYPLSGDFPTYDQFPHNTPDVPLWTAEPGYMYQLEAGMGLGKMSFMAWNENPPANHFLHSLSWPSRSHDYRILSGGRMHGFVEPGDPTDMEPHVGDRLLVNTGVVNSSAVRAAFAEHIDYQRLLRVPLAQFNLVGGTGQNQWRAITGFAIFRLHGYRIDSSTTWLLAEFVRWEDGCGQLPVGLTLTDGDDQTVLGGETAVYTHTLTNTGSMADTFSLTAESAHPWDITITPTETHALAWNESIPITVTVTVPMGVLSGTVNLVTVTAVSHADPAISHTVTNTTTSQAIIGVALSPPNEALATPTETVTYTHILTNTGSEADQFSLTAVSSQAWAVTIVPTQTAALASGTSIPVTVTISVPAGVLSGTVDWMAVTAVSHADPAISHTVTNTTTSQAIIGVALSPPNEALATPTETVTYTHILTNTGSEADQFSLTAVSSQAWAVTIVPTQTAALASGTSIPVTVTISVPAGVLSGTVDWMAVTAVSHADPATSHTVTNTTTSQAVVALALTPDNNNGAGQAGTWLTYTHTLQNLGSQADQFSVAISTTLGWEVVFGPTTTVTLAPQEAITLTVAVHIPHDALPEQVEQTTLTVTSLLDGQIRGTAVNQTTVLAPPPPPAPTYIIYLPFIGR